MTTSIISRRALQRLTSKYPDLLTRKPKPSSQNATKDDSTWPKKLQILGYAAVVAAIPYSLSVVVAESARVRSTLDESGGALGKSIVRYVRWYWGHEEDVPYYESLRAERRTATAADDGTDGGGAIDDRLQLRGEESPSVRATQNTIRTTAEREITFQLTTVGGLERTTRAPASTPLSDPALFGADLSERLIVSFDEHEEVEDGAEDAVSGFGAFGNGGRGMDSGGGVVDLGKLTAIWSAWNYFPTGPAERVAVAPGGGGGTAKDSTEVRIDELAYEISELQRLLQDPSCTRDRDDMEVELKDMHGELRRTRRMRRIGKLRNILS